MVGVEGETAPLSAIPPGGTPTTSGPLRKAQRCHGEPVEHLPVVLAILRLFVVALAECDTPVIIRRMIHRLFQRDDMMGGELVHHDLAIEQA